MARYIGDIFFSKIKLLTSLLVEQSGQGEQSNPILVIGDNPLAAGNNLL